MEVSHEVEAPPSERKTPSTIFGGHAVWRALKSAFLKLDPRALARNPVMLVVWMGSAFCTVLYLRDASTMSARAPFTGQLTIWLWATVLFGNFAEAMAEGRGKAQADVLRRARVFTRARRLVNGVAESASAGSLRRGDLVVCEAGDRIPADGEVVEGIASVDESAITGESAPVIRESGGDLSGVTGGTRVLSNRIVVRITADPGESFLDRMIEHAGGA